MRKLMMWVAMVAMVGVAIAPAIAQVSQGFEQSNNESGDASASLEVRNSGDNTNWCPTGLEVLNSGNIQNAQGAVQIEVKAVDELEFEGPSINIRAGQGGPARTEAECEQNLKAAAASE